MFEVEMFETLCGVSHGYLLLLFSFFPPSFLDCCQYSVAFIYFLIFFFTCDHVIRYNSKCLQALLKPRLTNFELILTMLEEDPPVLKLQSVVTAICRSLSKQVKLESLLLDMGLCTSQLVQICLKLEKCTHLTRLSLPHLRCERGAVSALAALLSRRRSLINLSLPSCWGARDDPPSSSGVSMGKKEKKHISSLFNIMNHQFRFRKW